MSVARTFWLHLQYHYVLQLRIKLTSQRDTMVQQTTVVTHSTTLLKILSFSPSFPLLFINQHQEFGYKGKWNENSCFREEVLIRTALLKKDGIIHVLRILKLQFLPSLTGYKTRMTFYIKPDFLFYICWWLSYLHDLALRSACWLLHRGYWQESMIKLR